VLVAGRPLTLPEDLHQNLAGLVMAFLPGSEGGTAVADALYGRAGFSGRLPFAWPAHVDAPSADPAAAPPAYAFGYGLSYTRFVIDDPTAELVGDTVRVEVSVTNGGEVQGRETVQVFAEAPAAAFAPSRLVGFTQVDLDAGETRRVTLEWPLERLAAGSERRVAAGTYALHVGEARVSIVVP
jgi:beta-glucosidase